MRIDRKIVKERFKRYTDGYNAADEKIALKIGHTYRVADLCDRIARSEGMYGEEADLAWLSGMLHDIGRFEQLRKYNTFMDADSVDHAGLGAEILFGRGGENNGKKDGIIREFVSEEVEDSLLETAVRMHSIYRVPENLDARTEKYCHILRDADKIDIQRVNIETPLEEIYNTTREELYHAQVTEAVMESFQEHHATLRSLKRTSVDHIAGHVSLIYELVFPESVRIVKEQGYWEKLLQFPSENPETRRQLAALYKEMKDFLEKSVPCGMQGGLRSAGVRK